MDTETETSTTGEFTDHPVGDSVDDSVDPGVRGPEERVRYDEVVVRRNGPLSVVLALICALVAAAFLSRGVTNGGLGWWLVAAALVAMTWGYVFTFLDSRTPLMVADDHGVRLRLGRTWRGMAWTELDEVEHQPRRWLRDGRLILFPLDLDSELQLLGPAGRRHASANSWLYRAAFTMPLALTTRVHGAHGDLTVSLAGLAAGRCPIVQIQSSQQVEVDSSDTPDTSDTSDTPDEAEFLELDESEPDPTRSTPSEPEAELDHAESVEPDLDETGELDAVHEAQPAPTPSPTPLPAREPRFAVRADVAHESDGEPEDHPEDDSEATQPFDLEKVASMDDTGVWRASTVVIDDVADVPAVTPTVGPVLATARRMLHLDVDQLAERTRIRPHVIEAIEIDDFAACGGDFYARGHLRTLARVLGVDVAPLLVKYDATYADAPIDPKRVFEADLASSGRGSIRSTRGGPNWSVLVAAVMTLVLAWSVARLVTEHPATRAGSPSLADGSAGLTSSETKASPVPVTLTAAGGGAHLVVRDGTGKVVFTGDLAFGQSRTLQVPPPVRVQSTDGSTRVSVQGKDQGKLGKTGQPAEHVYTAR